MNTEHLDANSPTYRLTALFAVLLHRYGMQVHEIERLQAVLSQTDRQRLSPLLLQAAREQGSALVKVPPDLLATLLTYAAEVDARTAAAAAPITPPKEITPRLLFARWLYQTGRINEGITA